MTLNFSSLNRKKQNQKIQDTTFDLVVIGGGITGAGIALDAASRGLKVCLLEKSDFASGTSSKSTKLIHGGLRYLKQFDFKLVRDTGTERAVVYQNAPHIVFPEKMLLPITKGGSYNRFMTWLGLSIYDRLAKVKKEERRKILSKKEVLSLVPKIKEKDLKGGGYYTEYRTDDARLTIEVLKTAVSKGAKCVNYVEVKSFIYDHNEVKGVKVIDNLNGDFFEIKSKQIINAAGPWSDDLRKMDNSLDNKGLYITKGIHIVVSDKHFKLNDTVYFDVPGGRMIFAIPREDVTYIGTTDTHYKEDYEFPSVTRKDVDYLLNAVKNMFPSIDLQHEDIISTWSGLRPLIFQKGKDPSEISRKDEVFKSPSGLITITGGKLTGYRLMAKKVVDIVCKRLDHNVQCKTRNLKLSGGTIPEEGKLLFLNSMQSILMSYLSDDKDFDRMLSSLYNHYGANITEIIEYSVSYSDFNLLRGEIEYVIKQESATNLLDYFIRRSGKMFFQPSKVDVELEEVAKYFGEFLNWEVEKIQLEINQVKEYRERMLMF